MRVVFINFLTALRRKALRQSPASRPLVLVIDQPRAGPACCSPDRLALVAAGAADELLSLPHKPILYRIARLTGDQDLGCSGRRALDTGSEAPGTAPARRRVGQPALLGGLAHFAPDSGKVRATSMYSAETYLKSIDRIDARGFIASRPSGQRPRR